MKFWVLGTSTLCSQNEFAGCFLCVEDEFNTEEVIMTHKTLFLGISLWCRHGMTLCFNE